MPASRSSGRNLSRDVSGNRTGLARVVRRGALALPGRNGDSDDTANKPLVPAVEWGRAARAFAPLPMDADRLETFARVDGSDEAPWDVMLQTLAMDEHQALTKLADRTGLRFIAEPKMAESSSVFYEEVPPGFARAHSLAGLSSDGHAVVVATSQPMQPSVVSMLEDMLAMPVRLVLSPRGAVASLINRGFEQRGDLVTEIIDEMPLDERAIESAAGVIGRSTDLLAQARQTPVIRLVNMILFEALRRRASDIHVHPMEDKLVIRYRVDGMPVDAFNPPLSLASAISSRLKVMTELDIANRQSPQDGQTSVRIGSKKVDIRLSVIPTIFGERIFMRLLDQSQTQLDLDAVGMSEGIQKQLLDCVERPNGMVLVTGPTGSGKTTTLYAVLGKIDRHSRNVMTIEDPVEYQLDSVSQMQVNAKRGVTFATGLRALLRQDPDVILVGEIRDQETAQLAIQASLTGHFVLATLHTNDAPSAIPRLIDIGVEPYLVTSSLLGVLAQRLMRRTCQTCGGSGRQGGSRCETCLGTGYAGRIACHEFMLMNDELRRLTGANADGVTLYNSAVEAGFVSMREDANVKMARGLTTEEEVFRVLH